MQNLKQISTTMLVAGFAMTFWIGAQAQAGEGKKGDKCPHDKSASAEFRPELQKATKLQGMSITNHRGQDLGTLEHLAVDTTRNQVVYGIVTRGGILDIGDKDTAVPWQMFRGSAEGDRLIAYLDKDTLKNSSNMTDQRISNLDDEQWAIKTHEHYEVKPYWQISRASTGGCPCPGHDKADKAGWSREQKTEKTQERSVTEQRERALQTTARDRDQTEQRERALQTTARDRDHGKHGKVIAADEIIGSKVKNQQGEELGELSDLMVDVQNGQVGYAILAHGGTLGIGESLTAVPMERFEFQPQGADQHPNVLARVTKDELKNAPSFKSSEWPDVTSRSWNREVHEYYGSEPYYVIYGFVIETDEPGQRGEQGTRGLRGEQDFAQGQEVSLRGTIQSIERNATGPGLQEKDGLQIQLKVDQDMTEQTSARQQPDAPSPRESAEDRIPAGERQTGDRQKLEGQTVTVNLAPESFLKQQGCELSQNDQVTIRGFRTTGEQAGRTLVVARTIQKDGTSVMLRRSDGQPMWSASSPGTSREKTEGRKQESKSRDKDKPSGY